MPLHMTSLVSRHKLLHPDEQSPAPATPLDYERVLKYNPNHGPDGRFASGGGNPALSTSNVLGALRKKNPTAVAAAEARYTGKVPALDYGFFRGAPQPRDPRFHKGPEATLDPNFHHGVGDAELAGSTPYKHAVNPAKISINNASRRQHARSVLGHFT